jgi:predicted transposase YbfD/YdcC
MKNDNPVKFSDYFSTLTDPRVVGRTDHKLIDIITIAMCGIICGADSWPDIEMYGRSKHEWFKEFLELPNGIPTQHTFRRFFIAVATDELETCFLNWVRSSFDTSKSKVVPIDGKTLRRSHDRSSGKAAIHMVNAWCAENGISLGQIKTREKSNEITAIPELIKSLELNDCIVTIDAMGCHTKIADLIVDKGADYILALKGNQPNLNEQVELFFEKAKHNAYKGIVLDTHATVDGDHGRIETRKYTTVSDIEWLQGKENWKDLKTIIMVESEREVNDEIKRENRYYISSLENGAKEIGEAVRSHWGIENSLHWKLDIGFREDECRKRKGNASANFAVVRQIALNLLNQEKTIVKAGVATKRKRAGWDNDYLVTILNI